MVSWTIKAKEFVNCNCAYGCPCQFNARPTHGNCRAFQALQIEQGHHDDTRLDGLRAVGVLAWPGAIHEGNGEAQLIIDQRATPAQRDALLRILAGQDTEPGATVWQVFSVRIASLFSLFSFTIFLDSTKRIFPEKARLADLGASVPPGSPADFGRLIADDTEKWAKVVKLSGAKPD